MHVEFTEKISASKWEKIIRNSENAYFYHTPMWADILERVYDYKTAARLYDIDGTDILVPLVKLKWHGLYQYHSTPMGYGGVFSQSEISSDMLSNILNDLKKSTGLQSILSMIFFPPFFNMPIQTDSYVISSGSNLNYTHILPLSGGFDETWKYKFTKKNRNMIRKAEKNGVEIFKGTTFSDYECYYQIYLDSVSRWKADNHHPLNLYDELRKHTENVKLWLARIGDTIIAGLITMEYGSNIIAFGGASLSKFWSYSPNNLLYKHAIEYASENGFKYFDFGQSGDLSGVRKFKESFGAEKVDLRKYVILSPLGRIGNMILKKY